MFLASGIYKQVGGIKSAVYVIVVDEADQI